MVSLSKRNEGCPWLFRWRLFQLRLRSQQVEWSSAWKRSIGNVFPKYLTRIRRIDYKREGKLCIPWFLGKKCIVKCFLGFFHSKNSFFLQSLSINSASSIYKFKFERVNLRGGRRGHFKMSRGHFKCQTVLDRLMVPWRIVLLFLVDSLLFSLSTEVGQF